MYFCWGFYMGYLVCTDCKGYYELQPGEKPEDFTINCTCGGELAYVKNLEYYKDNNSELADLDKNTQKQIKSILRQSITNGKGMRWASAEIKKIENITPELAGRIARTKTVEVRNQAEVVKALASGKEYFIVVSANDCCEKCYETYNGQVFSVKNDVNKLPPLHNECRCTASFFRSEGLAGGMASDISKP